MATRIRTLNFLPEIFQTPTNSQFLAATLDQLVAQPNTTKVEGFVGSKFGYGINATDKYVIEPTKIRTDYQLEPGVVFTKKNDTTATDFISYPGILDALSLKGSLTENNDRLFTSQFYSWDSFTNLDKIINYNQYYWLPEGPERVTISSDIVYNSSIYTVTDEAQTYYITSDTDAAGGINPTLTLLRGGQYEFAVNQSTQFWIQGEPGVTGYSTINPTIQTRNVYGVTNNGAEHGAITFNVPAKDALNQYNFPGNNPVGVVSTTPFNELNGARVNDIGGIDGVTQLDGLTVMFYNTGIADEMGYVGKFYQQTLYDQEGGVPYNESTDYPGTDIFDNNYEGGYYTDVNASFFLITLIGDPSNPIIQLTPAATIPTNQKIVPQYGEQWVNVPFYRSPAGAIAEIPYNSAILDTLYYQDGTNPNKVGIIKIVDSNATNQINIETQILGKTTYTAPNGVVFTNGLKVIFEGDIYPTSYANNEYYVEGVGTAIELISVTSLVSPGAFSEGEYIPYDTTPYDIGNYDSSLYVPISPDYITIARNAINKNPWSRSNRWFHIDVINATATYNNDPALAIAYTNINNKAKRPIIEFYPNLRLFDSGVYGKDPIDFIDFRTTDAFTYVAGQANYYPDVAGYTTYTADIIPTTTVTSATATETVGLVNQVVMSSTTGFHVNDTINFGGSVFGGISSSTTYYINEIQGNKIVISTSRQGAPVTLTSATGTMTTSVKQYTTTIVVPTTDVNGLFEINQYITDSQTALPRNSFISDIEIVGSNTVLYASWYQYASVTFTSGVSCVTTDTTVDNYALFDGSRVVFAADTDANVRNKIYVSRFSTTTTGGTPIITLTEADDGLVLTDEQTAVYRGYNYKGKDFYFDSLYWIEGQQKVTLNQSPKFDIFDIDGISFGNSDVYIGSSFTGCTLFSYGIGTGTNDPVLGFPVRYSSVDNVGDLSFDVTLNSQTFNYVKLQAPITQNVNTGYVYNYQDRVNYVRELGWQTAVSPSAQYQIFSFDWSVLNPTTTFTCDIAPMTSAETNWPVVQVYINNVLQNKTAYTYTTTDTTTTVSLTVSSLVDTVVQVTILSNQVSPTAYYDIPINLNNNPFNDDITTVNIGEIRGQYQSIFYNNPDTTGNVFGANNYRDLGNIVPWGNAIIQNSASLALPGAFLRKQDHSLFDSLLFNSRQYINFKTLLVGTVNSSDYTIRMSPAEMLDDALSQMTASNVESQPFFWSDMIPSKSPYITNTYSFANSLDISIYPLSRVYDFTSANYYGVLVYLTRNQKTTQLITGVDYTVSTTAPSLTVTTDLLPNDVITIEEYNQTYGSYIPNTPTKLGLYPASIPEVILDTGYSQPTYFILGHDGSYNKLYGDYDPVTGVLVDFRDQVLLEYEKRVYNNLKLSNTIPVQEYEVLPGFFRQTDYTYDEILEIYSEGFLDWVGQNRIDYKTQYYNRNDQFTYNYRNSQTKINPSTIEQGYWRGLYQYFYDTSIPDTAPWQMIGYRDMPSWWTSRYGAAPFTSDNLVLWDDLAQGIDWNNGNPIVLPQYVRTGLQNVLPVDSDGNLVSPFVSIVGNYNNNIFQRDWKVGDVGPAEFSYRRSSSYPFDLMRILALTRPAEFYNLAVDVDNYKYNVEFNQYLVNNRSHLKLSDIQVYGAGTPATSYINWIVDFEKQVGVDATTNITSLLTQLDVRLVFRLAGFSDKTLLKFYVEKSSANSNNSSLLIPDESYAVLLYDNQPFNRIVYSGVVIQITPNGYSVFGNSQTNAYFKTLKPKNNGNFDSITIESATVKLPNDFTEDVVLVPYNTEFYSLQEVALFLVSYGQYLEQQGMVFEQNENGVPVTWKQMVAEFLYWSQIGWEIGSITTLNPAATLLAINKDSNIVQPLTLKQQNFVLNSNLYPIQSVDLSINRDGTLFTVQPLNQGDSISYGQFNIGNIEHGIVFDNMTLFNDVIYNLPTGLRQNRVYLRGVKTADWNGTLDAAGFIYNQDNIVEWSREVKYTKGSIVKYKNKYWTALKIVQASEIFDENQWKETAYDEVQKGLLPNPSTRAYESTLYYDVNKANLENDADLLSFSLIGFRPRDYLAVADLTDITQVNVYQNMIKKKGTLDAASAFKGASLPQGGIDYDIYENWEILSGEFGGVLNNNFVEFKLSQPDLTGNPSIVGLTNGVWTEGVQQEVPLYSLYNYNRPISSPDILSTIAATSPSTLLPDAGYVNFNDVKMSSYFYSGLATARNQANIIIPINEFYVRDYVWVANYLEKWRVFSPSSIGSIVNAKNNLNGTVTITFANPHTLSKYELFGVVNFDAQVNGYYLVANVVDQYKVIINLSLPPATTSINALGVGFIMKDNRVATAPEIASLPLLDNEFNKTKVWVDENSDGGWAVYRKSLNFKYEAEINNNSSGKFGNSVAYADNLGYLIGDPVAGIVYRYTYDDKTNSYITRQSIPAVPSTNSTFGTTISHAQDIFVVSQPTGTPKVELYQFTRTTLVDSLLPYQTISAPGGVTNWGQATAISGDTNWIYISDILNNSVYVYRKSALDDLYYNVSIIDGDTLGLTTTGDNFGWSIATDYYGDTVVIGAPDKDFSVNASNYGYTYVFSRTVQNFEVQSTGQSYIPQPFTLAFNPNNVTTTASATIAASSRITVASITGINVGDPVVFSGTILSAGALSANTVYYVYAKGTTWIQVAATRGAVTPITLVNDSTGTMTVNIQTMPLTVEVNGTTIADSTYAIIGSTLYVYNGQVPLLNAGDIVNISSANFVLQQTLTNGLTPRVGVQFGLSVDTNKYANEILVGSPFELDSNNHEGAVHRFTNGGEKYGMLIGTSTCAITTPRTILLNGYSVTLQIGDATSAAVNINSANITNITASAVGGLLIISLIDNTLSNPSSKLTLSVLNSATPAELGFNLFTETQVIKCPHMTGPTQFGTVVKFSDSGSFIASAPTGSRFSATTFDFIDDELDNDTIFDNNTTTFIDSFVNAGAVYMFDYIAAYNESLTTSGAYVYAQSVNSQDISYGAQPMYGQALDFVGSTVIIGTPNFEPNTVNGQATIYLNASGVQDWAVYRSSSAVVDINKIENSQIFSASTNNTLINLDYFDPLQGKLLGAVRENIDVISNVDPASYNNPGATQSGLVWGPEKVGKIWFDTTNVKFVNYHQNDLVYNSQYWGKVFPGSDVAVYSWISSNVPPVQYTGPGTPYSFNDYTVQGVINAEGTITPVYYFWARNTNIIFEKLDKTLADSIIQSYIAQPQASGISYFAPLLPNIFGLYNASDYINANDSVFHLGYSSGITNDPSHTVYSLIRANYADDFLPGLPSSITGIPESLYARYLDSASGVDASGAVVPDPFLPLAVQSGVLVRPRQSFFYNRLGALENVITFSNEILIQYPFIEISDSVFLYKVGPINPSTGLPFYNVSDYVDNVNWWAPGYNDNTKASVQVAIYADLSTLAVPAGTIATVAQNGAGLQETYILDNTGIWNRIGLQYGTIQISSAIYDYQAAGIGFGDNFFDNTPYDTYPSEETKYILRALNEELPQDLLTFRNQALMLVFEYIQSETVENQNFLPWLNKTSFLDVSHTIRELKPIEVFQSDNQTFLQGYLNEVKPYHVVIKDFLFKYTGIDVFEGDITDFDLPAKYNSTQGQFITPELVYTNPDNVAQYLPSDSIWQSSDYNQWFNNYGLSITGQKGYLIAVLESYVALNSGSMFVNNVSGFPVNGVVTLGTEQIGYSGIDYLNNQLLGLSRGLNNTTVQTHIPGENIYIDLPAVVILNSGRNYAEPPKITAYIDTSIYPAPRVPAQLQPIMGIGAVIGVEVLNPGEGYATLPEIRIDPAFTVTFNSSAVDPVNFTIELSTPLLETGDLVVYQPSTGSTNIGGLTPGQKYYVGVLETSPTTLVSLYKTYIDASYDHDRIPLYSAGSGTQTLLVGAIASTITSAIPVRENNITLKYDRTSYRPKVIDWVPGSFYGSYYAGSVDARERVASSSLFLAQTLPSIYDVSSSAVSASVGDVVFEILDTENVQVIKWSSRTRNVIQVYGSSDLTYPNTITVQPTAGGSPVEGFLGSTIGFYPGMPIKFEGAAVGGLTNYTTYYVHSLVDVGGEAIGFTIADVNGSVINLTTATVPTAGLLAFPGEATNTALLTINYPGIRQVTATTSGSNTITVPLVETGLGGTNGFYTGLPIFFVGDMFGNLIENEVYYVTSVLGLETFTISTSDSPTIISVSATSFTGNKVTCASTLFLSVNEPIVFSGTLFGGLQSTVVYYIREITSTTTLTLATSINGDVVPLTNGSGSAQFTSQKDCVQLASATGSVTMNVSLPVSPGQINGQEFTLFNTGGEYVNVSGTVSNLVSIEIKAALATVNRLCLTPYSQETSSLYTNFLFTVSDSIGGLSTGTTYTVTGAGTTTVTVTHTSASGNALTCTLAEARSLYVGMLISFTDTSLGGVLLNTTYYVNSVNTTPDGITGLCSFTITQTLGGGPDFVVTTDNGTMVGTGDPYVTIANSLSAEVAVSVINLVQDPGVTPVFDISYILGGYTFVVVTAGTGYAVNNIITILGSDLGGQDEVNDLTFEVLTVDATGGVVTGVANGKPADNMETYYFKVVDANQVAVYSDPIMTVPVSGLTFPFHGATVTTATVATASNDRFTVTSSADFSVNDPVVFTGTVFGGITLGQTYYVKSKPTGTTVTVSTSIGGATFNITANDSGSMTMAKMGDYAILQTPFFFDNSIVKFNNRVYQCIVSNNDADFIFGKWELLNPGDRKLNELDRIVGYYQPTIDMPGLDIAQLVSGTTFPGSTYMGNRFAPDEEFMLDTILTDQPFYPTGINIQAIAYDGSSYHGVCNTDNYSAIINSDNSVDWTIQKIANNPIAVSNLLFVNGIFLTTTNDNALPLLKSNNGIVWSAVTVPTTTTILNSVAYYDGLYIAVGNNIIASLDSVTWEQVFSFGSVLNNQFNSVEHVSTNGFTGFIAVGSGQQASGITVQNISVIRTSHDGVIWSNTSAPFTPNGFNAVAYNIDNIVVVGNAGTIYSSFNTSTWYSQVSGTSENLNSIIWANNLFVAVGDNGTIITAPIDATTWTVRTSGTTENLQDITYNADAGEWVVVGENNTVMRSTNANTWTISSMFDTAPVVYNVQGGTFNEGYGPEELVPGLVTDTLNMTVVTRPGTNWSDVEYQHVGYNVVSEEITPETGTQTVYSFANLVITPAQLAVFVISNTTGLSTSIYEGISYTVDWVGKNIILNSPLTYGAQRLRIDVYEVGNGDQLVKANTETDPIRMNTVTGFQEIYVDANYTADISQGSGVVRPLSIPEEAIAFATNEVSDAITLTSVKDFVLNAAIYFSGAVFGNIVEDQIYYIKTISHVSKRITISETYNVGTGTAGATFQLSTATGQMTAIIRTGLATPWTDPMVYHNGTKLVAGYSSNITRTRADRDTITCNTTNGLIVNTPIVFSDTIFGGIVPQQTYYIKTIYDGNEFTISETQGGPTFALVDATGGATFITNDFTFGLADNGISASLIFAQQYDTAVDYLSYTLFGETYPVQYGATIPQTQIFTGTGAQQVFTLTNYVSGDNPANAIVEVAGLRIAPSGYTISSVTNQITFVSAPALNAKIAVTTYNLTDRQYFNTQTGITGSTVSSIVGISNVISAPLTSVNVSDTTSGTNYITCNSTSNLIVGQDIVFKAPVFTSGTFTVGKQYQIVSLGTTNFTLIGAASNTVGLIFTATGIGTGTGTALLANVGGIDTTGQVYYVASKPDSTHFTIKNQAGSTIVLTTASASLVAYMGGQPAIRVVTSSANNLTQNAIVRIDQVQGSVQLNNNTYYARIIGTTTFDLYTQPYNPALYAVNYPVTSVNSYEGGGYVWLDETFTIFKTQATATNSIGNVVTVTATEGLALGTPIVFTKVGAVAGTDLMGGILAGTTYYVKDILGITSLTISETRDGEAKVLTSGSNTVQLSEFEQTNVDRLWVTINGYRVPSSSLKLNAYNNLSILAQIQSSDNVIITSMIPSATPNEETYFLTVSNTNQPSVYRANVQTRTWLTQPLYYTDSMIYLNDVTRVTDSIVEQVVAPAPVDGIITVGLTADKNTICDVAVYNYSTNELVDPTSYSIVIIDLAPVLRFTDQVNDGDDLTITITQGNLLYLNGEKIIFTNCDSVTNTVTIVTRGAYGTARQDYIPLYTEVFGLLAANMMTDVVYNETWNSNIYNTVQGDPLQISQTVGADFLKVDRT